MKILFVQTNYEAFLENFYQKTKNWQMLSYSALKNKWAKECFGISNFYSKNLKRLGWEGFDVVVNDWNMQSKWAKERGLMINRDEFPFNKYIPASIKNLLGLRSWLKKIFLEQLEFYKPYVVYIFDLSLFSVEDLKKIKSQVKLLVGQIAYPLPLNKRLLHQYDLIISSFPHYVKMFRRWGIKSEYLKLCVEKTLPKVIGKKRRIYNITFVGGLIPHHKKGNAYLSGLAQKMKVDVWGYGEKTLPPGSPIKRNFHGEAWGREMYEIFAKSKIIINRHIDIAQDYANNLRMFESTAMGALLITDEKKNMYEFFKVGKEIITYKNTEELISKVNYYLSHPREREITAKAGQVRTLRDHIYSVRMLELDKIIRGYI